MMECTFMRYTGHPMVVRKTPSTVSTQEVALKQPFTFRTPKMTISGAMITRQLIEGYVNYVRLKLSNKTAYYYIVNYTIDRHNLVEVDLMLDVLKTYESDINQMDVVLERSEQGTRFPILDSMIPTGLDTYDEYIDFENQFHDDEENGTYVMVTSQSGYLPVEGQGG